MSSCIARTIEVISVPHGDAPAWVRAAWVGCRFPTSSCECGHIPQYVTSVLPSEHKGLIPATEYLANPEKYAPQKIDGYSIDQAVALEVLEKRNPKAAAWWRNLGFPKKGADENAFRFKLEEVLVVDTYSHDELMKRGPIVRYDDMETGTMRAME